MNRDWIFGLATALAVAFYPNLIEVTHSPAEFDRPVFWLGVAIAVSGIVLAWRDPLIRR